MLADLFLSFSHSPGAGDGPADGHDGEGYQAGTRCDMLD